MSTEDGGSHVDRPIDRQRVLDAMQRSPVVLVTGARQVGKTTLVQRLVDDTDAVFFDLENPRHAARLEQPLQALEGVNGIVVIDEAQRQPDIFTVLRVLADRPNIPARFVVLGSASPELVGLSAQTLAGRVELVDLGGLRATDVGAEEIERLWVQGSYPRAFVLDEHGSTVWRDNYIATFLERDLAQLGFRLPATQMRRFWTMLAHYHGQTWNGAELARALGVAQSTIRRYLDALTDALVVRQLQPWFTNTSKRLVRSPKVYLRDSGLLHRLLLIDNREQLLNHPKVGASWEGFAIEQIAMRLGNQPLHFWGTQGGAELDLFAIENGRRIGYEFKRADAPRTTRSMHSALDSLNLDLLYVVYPGPDRYQITDRIEALPLANALTR